MTGSGRRGPVGPGYMPKGGRKAAAAHNRRVAAPAAAVAPPPLVEPMTDGGRMDTRASAGSAARRTERIAVVGVAVVSSVVTTGLLEVLSR